MADRKKQPARGARKRKTPKKAAPESVTVEPLEVRLQLVGIQRDSKNDIIGTAVMAEGTVLPKDFSSIPKQLKDAVKKHQEATSEGSRD